MTKIRIVCRALAVVLMGLSGMALGGCATLKVQAPYDAFVCFNSTFNKCASTVQAGQLKALQRDTARSFAPAVDFVLQDPEAGKIVPTSDKKYRCEYGTIPYKQLLTPDETGLAVFVSPVLLRQITEQAIRVSRARVNCERLIQGYKFQQEIIALQDQLSIHQIGAEFLGSEVDEDRDNAQSAGERPLLPEEIKEFGLDPRHLAFGERQSRQKAVRVAEQVRAASKTQVLEVDFKRQFEDANVTIDLQLRELARSLFVLDRSIFKSTVDYEPKDYGEAAWVRQGTIVLKSRRGTGK